MKLRYPIIGIVALFISATIWENILGTETYNKIGHPIMVILLLSLLGLTAYLLANIAFNEISELMDDVQHYINRRERHREQQTRNMEQINRELDEIEASLNAITENDKITPIWEISHKEP